MAPRKEQPNATKHFKCNKNKFRFIGSIEWRNHLEITAEQRVDLLPNASLATAGNRWQPNASTWAAKFQVEAVGGPVERRQCSCWLESWSHGEQPAVSISVRKCSPELTHLNLHVCPSLWTDPFWIYFAFACLNLLVSNQLICTSWITLRTPVSEECSSSTQSEQLRSQDERFGNANMIVWFSGRYFSHFHWTARKCRQCAICIDWSLRTSKEQHF